MGQTGPRYEYVNGPGSAMTYGPLQNGNYILTQPDTIGPDGKPQANPAPPSEVGPDKTTPVQASPTQIQADQKQTPSYVSSTNALAGYGKDLLGVGDPANPQTAAQGNAYNPNQAFLTQQSFGASQTAQGNANADRAHAQTISQGQDALGAAIGNTEQGFNRTINDPNAPSVARTQLGQTIAQNARNALGDAAGVGGTNAFAARRAAMTSIADNNTAAAGSADLLRAKEVQDAQTNMLNAQQTQGQILGQQAGAASNALGTDTTAGVQYENNAMSGAEKQQQQDIDARNQQKKDRGYLGSQIEHAMTGGLGI
jgi:hypothetical protein